MIPALITNLNQVRPQTTADKLQKAMNAREVARILEEMPSTSKTSPVSAGLLKEILARLVHDEAGSKDKAEAAQRLFSEIHASGEAGPRDASNVLRILCQFDFETAKQFHDKLQDDLRVPETSNVLLEYLCNQDDPTRAVTFYDAMRKNIESYCLRLNLAFKENPQQVTSLLEGWPSDIRNHQEISSALAVNYCNAGMWEQSRENLGKIPSEVRYASPALQAVLLKLADRDGGVEKVLAITSQMSVEAIEPALALWTSTSSNLSKQSTAEDAHQLLDQFEAMTSQSAPIEVYADAISRLDAEMGLDIFRRAQAKQIGISVDAALPLLEARNDRGEFSLSLETCFDVFLALPLDAVSRGGSTLPIFEATLDHCANLSSTSSEQVRQSHYSIAMSVLADMAKVKLLLPIESATQLPQAYFGLLALAPDPKTGFEMYCALHAVSGSLLSSHSYIRAMQSFAETFPDQVLSVKLMLEIMMDMRAAGFVPDQQTYIGLLNYYSRDADSTLPVASRFNAVQTVHATIRMDPTMPSLEIKLLATILAAYARVRAWRRVHNVWQEILLRAGDANEAEQQDLVIGTCFALQAAGKMRRKDRISSIWNQAHEFGLRPEHNSMIIEACLSALIHSDAWSSGLAIAKSLDRPQMQHLRALSITAHHSSQRDRFVAWLEHMGKSSSAINHIMSKQSFAVEPTKDMQSSYPLESTSISWVKPDRNIEAAGSHPTHFMTAINGKLLSFRPDMMQRTHNA